MEIVFQIAAFYAQLSKSVVVTLLGLSNERFEEFNFISLVHTSNCAKMPNFSFLGLILKFGAMDTTDLYDPHRSSFHPIIPIFELVQDLGPIVILRPISSKSVQCFVR